jgi:tripartite-type tricarboxylate transporter receptor subunit TctC
MMKQQLKRAAATLVLGVAVTSGAQAQSDEAASYPNRAIRIVVPASPGGVNDILARLVGQKLSESFKQTVVIENKAGAATIIGTDYVAKQKPDGYTLLSAPLATMAVNPAVYSKLSYAPLKDFVPISLIASYPYVLAVNKDAPVKSVSELIDYTKKNPTQANAGGASATFQLVTELFKQRTGAPVEYVPYKGANDATVNLISGTLLLSFIDSGPAAPQIKGGQIRALAVTSGKRMASFPDVPTLAEAGVKDMEATSWSGFFAPAGTPPAIVQKLSDEIRRIVQLPDIREKLAAQELEPVGTGSEEFARILAKDIETWTAVAKAGNIKVE